MNEVNKTMSFYFRTLLRCSYIGSEDSKVFPKLISNPPYKNASINKIEDVNHLFEKDVTSFTKNSRRFKENQN